jgi:hypothetical protein
MSTPVTPVKPGAPQPAPGAPVVATDPAAKPKKVAKPKKEGAAARPRLAKYPDEHKITVLKENAKARGANERFKRYLTGMTVKQYVDKMTEDFQRTSGQTFADMRWDEDHKFIHIGPEVIPVPVPAPAPTPTPAQAQPSA